MFQIVFEPVFREDYRRVKQVFPSIAKEFRVALELLQANGELPEEYGAHKLVNPGGNYNGHMDFHLSEGGVDVVVLYMPHKTNPSIRFVRVGSHAELFRGPVR